MPAKRPSREPAELPPEGRPRSDGLQARAPSSNAADPAARPTGPDGAGRELRGLGPRSGPPITELESPPAVLARDAVYRRVLLAADVVAVLCTLALSLVIIGGGPWPAVALLAVPLVIGLNKGAGLYDRDELLIRKSSTLDELPTIVHVSTLVALLAAIGDASGLQLGLGGPALLTLWLGQVVLLALFRTAARSTAMRWTPAERCLIVGDADVWAEVRRKLAASPHMNSRVCGYVPMDDRIRADDPQPLGAYKDLDCVVRQHDVHRVIVAPSASGADESLDVVRRAKALGVRVTVVPRILEVVGSLAAFDDIDGMTVLGVRHFGLAPSAAIFKRALDVTGAAAGLLVTAPFFALVATAIKLDSPGPVFFRQSRVGRNDHVLEILKFRTMLVGAEERKAQLIALNETEGLFKIADDPRVTRVGRWLRRASLDELPQLVNVLRGEMSLVGPRPLVLSEDRHVEGWHRRRLHIKPGMTGLWQILGSGRTPLYEMLKIDYLYVANWSLWGDIKILLRTVLYIAARRNV